MDFKEGYVRKTVVILGILSLFICMTGGIIFADETQINIRVWGRDMVFNYDEPRHFIDENGRTQMPFCRIFEKIGAEVSWDDQEQIAIGKLPDYKVEIPIGKNHIVVNGKVIKVGI